MESKHTPGPWYLEIIKQSSGHLYGVMGACADEQDANTALIKAAPALLSACQLALEVFRREGLLNYNGEDEFVDPDGVKGIGDVLSEAIEQAEG